MESISPNKVLLSQQMHDFAPEQIATTLIILIILPDHAVLEFNEKNVRNAIANINNIRELGEKLAIPSGRLDMIDRLPLENQKQKFVEVWFKFDIDCNWKCLIAAIDEMKVSWVNRSSTTDLLSPASTGSHASFGSGTKKNNYNNLVALANMYCNNPQSSWNKTLPFLN